MAATLNLETSAKRLLSPTRSQMWQLNIQNKMHGNSVKFRDKSLIRHTSSLEKTKFQNLITKSKEKLKDIYKYQEKYKKIQILARSSVENLIAISKEPRIILDQFTSKTSTTNSALLAQRLSAEKNLMVPANILSQNILKLNGKENAQSKESSGSNRSDVLTEQLPNSNSVSADVQDLTVTNQVQQAPNVDRPSKTNPPSVEKDITEGNAPLDTVPITKLPIKKDSTSSKQMTQIKAVYKSIVNLQLFSEHQSIGDPKPRSEPHSFGEAMKTKNQSIVEYNLEISSEIGTPGDKTPVDEETLPNQHTAAQHGSPETTDESKPGTERENTQKEAPPTSERFIQVPKSIFNSIQYYMPSSSKSDGKKGPPKKTVVPKALIDKQTRDLSRSVKGAISLSSRLTRLEDLCTFLLKHPESRGVAYQEKMIPTLLTWRQSNSDQPLQKQINEALAILGYVFPVKRRGINVLCLDGGGIRGLIAIKILKELEKHCNKSIYEMFDYVTGVSTGSLIQGLIFVANHPLDTAEDKYKDFGRKVFYRKKLIGAVNLMKDHSYYDSQLWENVLRENIGEKTFRETAQISSCPKVSVISAIMNAQKVQSYVFRNYEYPQGAGSHFRGSMRYKVWEGVKASSAAPGYFEECKYDEFVHQDGGILTNNPTAIAIHECKILWPNTPLQCVVSIGTGRYEPQSDEFKAATLSNLIVKLDKMIQSATDTEGVHKTVEDLLPPPSYYRFNPYLSKNISLDDTVEENWQVMYKDIENYCTVNKPKIKAAAHRLNLEKSTVQSVVDWAKIKLDKYDVSNSLSFALRNLKEK